MENHPDPTIPRFPSPLARALRFIPLVPVSFALTRLTRNMATSHASMYRRLGDHAHKRFLLDPTDLPIVLCLEPKGGHPRVTISRHMPQADARIAGPLAALLGLVHGAYDGDALFFSRDLVIEGDTAAALALRNAVDDAEIDIAGEIETLSGPFARPLHKLIALAERRTGVALTRHEEDLLW